MPGRPAFSNALKPVRFATAWLGLVLASVPALSSGQSPALAERAFAAPSAGSTLEKSRKDDDSPGWKTRLKTMARNSLADLEDHVDVAWRRFADRTGIMQPQHIASYSGYGNEEQIWVTGRLLANSPYGGPTEDDDWFDNLRATYSRWNSREVAGATVTLSFNGQVKRVTTDREGYYSASFERKGPMTARDTVYAEYRPASGDPISALHTVHSPAPGSRVMIVSDMDDTVIHTGITDLLVAAQLTFLNNARTRKPLAGVGSLYRALSDGAGGNERNPVFYVSNSAWNMYDLLRDFLELNDIPDGPVLLRDIGLERVGEGSSSHKIETITGLLERFPDLPVVLVGDSGQHDVDIYRDVARKFPDRILAIYIRDIDPDSPSTYDTRVDGVIDAAGFGAIPFLRVADSSLIAAHARELGLLTAEQVASVDADTQRDWSRDSLGEQALDDAVALESGS